MTSPSPAAGDAGPPVVEYCVNNVDAATRARLADAPVESRGAPCLERCGTCVRTPFLVVDGDCRVAGTHDDLLAAIEEVSP